MKRRDRPPKQSGGPSGWDPVADWYEGRVGEGGREHHRRLAIPAVLDLLLPQSGYKIIDIGAAPDVLAPFSAEAQARYTGVDVSPKLL